VNPMRSRLLHALLVASMLGAVGSGCRRHSTTDRDCAAILDRLVELELSESGYQDPIVRARWKNEARRRFAGDLRRCAGLTVRNDLARCLLAATTTEEIVHRCVE
jgi:hypothetical protein